VVVGAPLDATTTFQPGTRFGPDRIRRFAETYDDYDRRTDSDFSALGVCDAGDVRSWDDVKEYLDHLAAELRSVTYDDAVPPSSSAASTPSRTPASKRSAPTRSSSATPTSTCATPTTGTH